MQESRLPEEVHAFNEEVASQYSSPPNGETVVANALGALQEAQETLPAVARLVVDYNAHETIPNMSYRVRNFVKKLQAPLLRGPARIASDYPRAFDGPEGESRWLDYLGEQYADLRNPVYQWTQRALRHEPYRKNRFERKDVLAFVIACAMQRPQEPFDNNPTILDIGSANDHVLKALGLRYPPSLRVIDGDERENIAATRVCNFVANTVLLGEGIGVEAKRPRTAEEKLLLKSDTLEPSELDLYEKGTGKGYEDNFEGLLDIKSSRVWEVKGTFPDLATDQLGRIQRKNPSFTFLSHVLSQESLRSRRAIDTIIELMNHHGWIIVDEYATVDPNDPQHISLLDHWYEQEWLCQTMVMDAAHPDDGFVPLLLRRNASSNDIRPLESGKELMTNIL